MGAQRHPDGVSVLACRRHIFGPEPRVVIEVKLPRPIVRLRGVELLQRAEGGHLHGGVLRQHRGGEAAEVIRVLAVRRDLIRTRAAEVHARAVGTAGDKCGDEWSRGSGAEEAGHGVIFEVQLFFYA